MKETPYSIIRDYLASAPILTKVTRVGLLKLCIEKVPPCSAHTVDCIRRHFTVAGYLQRESVGVYMLVSNPDKTLSKSKLLCEAYGYFR